MGWAGGSDATDSRWRCYGLPRGAEQRLRDGGVNFHSFETRGADGRAQEEQRNWASCCDVEILDELDAALCNVAASAARAVGNAYPPGAGRDDLVALQPNVHAGAAHLPSHFDWPLHDGFGVVIVTISMQRSATVVLNDDQAKEWSFNLDAGEAYALTGKARNVCSHGVLCDPKVVDRESLNLRFGLHTQPRAEREIYAAWSQEPWCTAQGPVVFE
ncbi:hypothetical protein M885DRAFT_520326 [Pelagophyceae sp. CCMP2097]|nr:hypothetical protein M885DRAFT_520326 [Pelagophyceae sp. CCMP2097]